MSSKQNTTARFDGGEFGIAVGHATDAAGGTGLTVVRGIDAPLRASAHILGRATGSRELALLEPAARNDRIDAIMLTGGSAFGLDAAAGVMRWMEERGQGHPVGQGVVPIVPSAVVFDLAPLGR
ncbi:MAG TPA: P1 family peptidase, partial [Gemmatimonadaceae bacterium]|nr:P1 family peptidase [Gemmatimonadaceae bacterium]